MGSFELRVRVDALGLQFFRKSDSAQIRPIFLLDTTSSVSCCLIEQWILNTNIVAIINYFQFSVPIILHIILI